MIDNLITNDVTILVPTKNRPNFLFRLLNFYYKADFKGCILIGDASDDNFLQEIKEIISSFNSKINIKYFIFNEGVNSTIEFLSQKIETTYCLYCSDDDFIAPNGIAKSLVFLKENPEYNAVHGKGAMITLDSDGCFGNMVSLFSYPQAIVDGESAAERLKNYLIPPYAMLYSLHRTDSWKKMFRGFSSYEWAGSQQITIDELLSSGISAILGKIKEIDDLYLIRQSHSNASGGNRLNPYELVIHKHWSIAIKDMSKRFIDEIMSKDQIEYDEAKDLVNKIYLSYLEYIFISHQQRIDQKDVSLVLIKNLIKKYMPLYLKIFITNTLFFRNKKKSLLSMRVLEDQSSIYYNDMMLIKNVCLEKLKDE
jgi:glycosyltransferase domain-containing protein